MTSPAPEPDHAEQPLGAPVAFSTAARPSRRELAGRFVSLRPLQPDADGAELFRISHAPEGDPRIWTYLFDEPFMKLSAFRGLLEAQAASEDPTFFTVVADGRPSGIVSYLAIVPEHGTIELGNIWFGPALQRTPAATEAIFLLTRHAIDDLNYRRVEWKCNALNGPSRRAAERFGFSYEGTFAQHRVVKGRNRDTAWFAITDGRWPEVRAAFEAWLSPDNFDAAGQQRRSLASFRNPGGATHG